MDREFLEKVGEIMEAIADEMDGCHGPDGKPCNCHAVRFDSDALFTAKLFLEKLAVLSRDGT